MCAVAAATLLSAAVNYLSFVQLSSGEFCARRGTMRRRGRKRRNVVDD